MSLLRWICVFSFGCATTAIASELTVEGYLQQVAEKDGNYRSADAAKSAAQLYGKEADLLYALTLFGVAEDSDDQKPGILFNYDELVTKTFQLGVSENTSIGLSGKLFYQILDTDYTNLGLPGSPPISPSFTQASPTLQLTLPLWRNFWGGENRANVSLGEANTAATFHTQSYQLKQILEQAETAYWQLMLARESVRVSQDSVTRNNQLVSWHRERASTGLADRADLLQAEAALQSAVLNLKTSQDNEVSAARAFNLARGVDGDTVPETLVTLTTAQIAGLQKPERAGHREDVLAAADQQRATSAAADLARQKYLPTVELYGTYALNNGDPTNGATAYADSFNSSRPTRVIGLRFNAPLDIDVIRDSRQGHLKDKLAADLTYERKLLEEDSTWHDLVRKHQQAQDRYGLYVDLEAKQKTKFEYEQHRRKLGRTTTQQVLNFQTDYESAQLGRIQTLSELLQIRAQMKLFAGATHGSR